MTHATEHRIVRRFAQPGIAAMGLMLLCLAAVQTGQLRPQLPPSTHELRLGDNVYAVEEARLPWLEQLTQRHFGHSAEQALPVVLARVDRELDGLFALAESRVPELADWYYSFGGEYTRLLLPLLVNGGLMEPDHLAQRTEQILFGDRALGAELDAIRNRLDALVAEQGREAHAVWITRIEGELGERQRLADETTGGPALDLDVLGRRLAGYDSPEFLARVSASSVAGVGALAGPMIWQAASRRAAASGRVAAGRVAGRTAGRAGGAAASGALACAPAGPAAVGCAVLAGAGAWIATDWLLLRVDEARNREDLEARLRASLDATREDLRATLHDAYREVAAARQNSMRADIQQTFVPAYAFGDRAQRQTP